MNKYAAAGILDYSDARFDELCADIRAMLAVTGGEVVYS